MFRSRLRGPAVLAGLLVGLTACERGADRLDPTPEPLPSAEDADGDAVDPGTGDTALRDRAAAAPTPAEYRLTQPAVERYAEASKQLRQLAERDPAPMRRLQAKEAAARSTSLEETASRLEGEPAVREAIESAGLSSREYALITITLSEAILVQQALAQGSIDRPPPGVAEDNIEFVRTHRDEISRLLSEVARDP